MTENNRLYIRGGDLVPFLAYVCQLSADLKETQPDTPLTGLDKHEDGVRLGIFGGRAVNIELRKDEKGLYIEDADHWEGHTDEQWQDLRAFLGKDITDPSTFVFTDDLTPISKQGGEVEESCRRMVVAGVQWFRDNPGKAPKFVMGAVALGKESMSLLLPINDDAAELDAVLSKIAKIDDGTYESVLRHITFIMSHGWKVYCLGSRISCEEEEAKERAEIITEIEV